MIGVLGLWPTVMHASSAPAEILPMSCTIYANSSVRNPSGVFLDIDLCSTDWLGSWKLRTLEIVDVVSSRVVLRLNAHTAGFVTDGQTTIVLPGSCVTAVVPIPPGAAHRELMLRVSAKNMGPSGGVFSAELPVSQKTLANIGGDIAADLAPGPLTLKQGTFFAVWGALSPLLSAEDDVEQLYAALKAAHLSGQEVSP